MTQLFLTGFTMSVAVALGASTAPEKPTFSKDVALWEEMMIGWFTYVVPAKTESSKAE